MDWYKECNELLKREKGMITTSVPLGAFGTRGGSLRFFVENMVVAIEEYICHSTHGVLKRYAYEILSHNTM